MLVRGIPEHIRSDSGPEFIAKELRKWLGKVGTKTLYIEPGSPWENGYCELWASNSRAMWNYRTTFQVLSGLYSVIC